MAFLRASDDPPRHSPSRLQRSSHSSQVTIFMTLLREIEAGRGRSADVVGGVNKRAPCQFSLIRKLYFHLRGKLPLRRQSGSMILIVMSSLSSSIPTVVGMIL